MEKSNECSHKGACRGSAARRAGPRVSYAEQSPQLTKKLTELAVATTQSAIEESIRTLVAIRASQINGCSFCLDMHVKQARIQGERELRIYHLPSWRDSTLFAPREHAALTWTEILTKMPEQGVPDGALVRYCPEYAG
jgi:AhpD family alkylhydroperoxidase